MKIAMLTDCYLPRLGGIEVQVHDLSAQLVAAGHELEVFTATAGAAGERDGVIEVVDGIAVHRLATRMPWELPVNPLAPPELRRRLVAGGFDVAHVHTGVVSPFAWDCVRSALRVHVPVAMTWHCVLDRAALGFRVTGAVARWARRGVAMSGVSEVAAAPLRSMTDRPISLLPNGIDVGRWSPSSRVVDRAAERTRSGGDEVVRLVTAMRLALRKRPLPLLRVVEQARALVSADRQMELTILGDGPDRGKVERFIAEHGLADWVRLPGRVSRDELRDIYHDADIYLSPAELESFGIAALEARTAGLPVITRHGSGVGEFVTDGVNGFLASDDKELAVAIARLVMDDRLRATMTAYNLDHRPVQDWPQVVRAAEEEYARAIRSGR